ncbi:hypothetical protein FRB97_005057 [Tulasnella sp. 331]|nr:hypothetical protein FRB97_005057 [Tulasnella sp. 331]KAG8866448.1 hypothetical protein FRB98_004731 [Tulasnella sp. 332]
MAKRNGPMLKRLYLSCLSPFEPAELEDLTRTLATFHVNLTLIRLSLFSLLEDPASPDVIEFERVRPLLQCTALSMLLLWHNGPMMYGEEDVAMMGHAWPDMMCLELCLDPTDDVARAVGQPLSIIGVLIRTFPKLEELGVYVNEAGVLPNLLEPKIGLPVPPLRILDFGTSPPARLEESDPKEDIAMYLASVCPPGVGIWNSRSVSHVRNVEITEEQEEEHARRSVYWEDMAEKVNLIHMGMKYMATGISGLVAR